MAPLKLPFLAVLLGFTFASCTPPAHAESAVPVLKIGASIPLTGALAIVGEDEVRGLEIGIDEVNSAGTYGVRLQLFVEDNQGDPKAALSGVSALLSREKPPVIYTSFTHITKALSPVLERSGTLLIYAAVVKDMAKENPLAFRDFVDAEEAGREMGSYILKAGLKRLSVFSQTRDYCDIYLGALVSRLKDTPITVGDRQNFQPDERDFRPLLLKSKLQRPDGIVLCALGGTGLFMRQMSEVGMASIPAMLWLAPDLPEDNTPELMALYEKNGSVSNWHDFIPSDLTPAQREFTEAYRRRYHAQARPGAAFSHDDAILLAAAAGKCKASGITPACLARELNASTMDGVAGRISFDENRSARRGAPLVKVERGEWVRIRR